MKRTPAFILSGILLLGTVLSAAPDRNNKIRYEKAKSDKVIEQIRKQYMEAEKKGKTATDAILKKHREKKKKARMDRSRMISDLTGVMPPASPDAFKQFFHFPPQAQYFTSTCWSFCTTSYYESEIHRLTGKKIKLSEMWTPYWELIEKSRGFIRERGNSYVAGGGESNSFERIWKKHGVVPAEAYSGLLPPNKKHNHVLLMRELKNYLSYIKENSLWDEEENLKHISLILNRHMGAPPKTFTWEGRKMTPLEFLNETGLNMDDYVSVMSTSRVPFFSFQEFKVPDNWWHSRDYLNLPLEKWLAVIRRAVKNGYSVNIGGDTSEPGKNGEKDLAFIPSFDIPTRYINQDARELRIYNRTTQDDHGIHIVGWKHHKGWNWYLIKDSGRSARKGSFDGYYMYREDYIKLKMLTFTIHKDMLSRELEKVGK